MSFLQVEGANIYYELHGQGDPLVLIAGYTCDYRFYAPFIPFLSSKYQVLVYDHRAVGQTKDDGRELSIELLAHDLFTLCHSLKLSRPHIIGQSMGGAIAQFFASTYPEQVNKLVLLATTNHFSHSCKMALGSLLGARAAGIDVSLLIDMTIPWLLGEAFLSKERNILEFKKFLFEAPCPQSLKDQQRQFALLEKARTASFVNKIKAKTLVLYGEEDRLIIPKESKRFVSELQNATSCSFACGHDMVHEKTEELLQAILNFLA